MKKVAFICVAAGVSLTLSACAVPPGHRMMPGNSAYGHAQGNGPHKKSGIAVYGTVDMGIGHTHKKFKHH